MQDTLRRVARGEQPIADLTDMAAAMDLVEAAYAAVPCHCEERSDEAISTQWCAHNSAEIASSLRSSQ